MSAVDKDRDWQLLKRAGALRDRGCFDEAIELYNGLLLRHPISELYNERGVAYSRRADFERALEDFTIAIELAPGDADCYVNRGNVYLRMLDYEKAAEDYTKAIALAPYMAVAFNGLGVALEKLGHDDDARVNFARASQLDKQYVSPRYNYGRVLARIGLIDQARAHLEEALVLSPRDCEILCALGDVSTMAGDYAGALRYFERGLDEPLGHQHLAWLLATCPEEGIRNGSRAVAHATIACRQTGWKDPGYLETLAAAYAESGNFGEAVALQTRAIQNCTPDSVMSAEARLRLLEKCQPIRDWRGK